MIYTHKESNKKWCREEGLLDTTNVTDFGERNKCARKQRVQNTGYYRLSQECRLIVLQQ